MSDPVFAGAVSALGGVSFDGFATVREIGPVGMVTLREDGLRGIFDGDTTIEEVVKYT